MALLLKEKPVVTGWVTATSLPPELEETEPVSQHSHPANAHCLILSRSPVQHPS